MQVIVKYRDNLSFLPEEVIRQAEQNYGSRATVTLLPDSDTPIDHLYFAVQRMITGDLISAYYDHEDVAKIKREFIYKVDEVVDDVIQDILVKLGS